jgi:hypothetical protein
MHAPDDAPPGKPGRPRKTPAAEEPKKTRKGKGG